MHTLFFITCAYIVIGGSASGPLKVLAPRLLVGFIPLWPGANKKLAALIGSLLCHGQESARLAVATAQGRPWCSREHRSPLLLGIGIDVVVRCFSCGGRTVDE